MKLKNLKFLTHALQLLVLTGILTIGQSCTFDKEDFTDCTILESLAISNSTNTQCGLSTGSIEISIDSENSDIADLVFQLNDETPTNNLLFENLAAGTYEITAILENGICTNIVSTTIENEDGLNFEFTTNDADCGTANGRIDLSPSNASGNVQYKIENGAFQDQASFDNLTPGSYTITAIDDSGCEVTQIIKLNSKVTLAQVQEIINTNCAVSGCHAGNVDPDFTVPENITLNSDRIEDRTANQTMPPSSSGMSLDQNQIDAIACWAFDNQ